MQETHQTLREENKKTEKAFATAKPTKGAPAAPAKGATASKTAVVAAAKGAPATATTLIAAAPPSDRPYLESSQKIAATLEASFDKKL